MAKGGSAGGIGGSGIFGGVGVGALVTCKSDDSSWYCTITKFFSLFFQFVIFAFIVYYIYGLSSPYIKKWFRIGK